MKDYRDTATASQEHLYEKLMIYLS